MDPRELYGIYREDGWGAAAYDPGMKVGVLLYGYCQGSEARESRSEERPVTKKPIAQVLKEHTERLMALPGVVGTAQGLCHGEPCIKVFVVKKTEELLERIPEEIEGYTVDVQQTGEFKALDSP